LLHAKNSQWCRSDRSGRVSLYTSTCSSYAGGSARVHLLRPSSRPVNIPTLTINPQAWEDQDSQKLSPSVYTSLDQTHTYVPQISN